MYPPSFTVDQIKLQDSIKEKTNCESVKFTTLKVKDSEQMILDTQLQIDIINPKNFPITREDLKKTTKPLVVQARNALKNSSEYSSFKINIITEKVNGSNSYSKTVPIEFKAEEL